MIDLLYTYLIDLTLFLACYYRASYAKKNQLKIAIIFLSISLNICFGAQKNRLIETVPLGTHKICLVEK